MTAALCVAAVAAAFIVGYLAGLRANRIDNDSFWQGFADGERFATAIERTPSPN